MYYFSNKVLFISSKCSFLSFLKFLVCALFCLGTCQTKQLTPFEEAKNPYAHLGVEGYMGAAMTSCLGMVPQGPPIVRKKDMAPVVPDDHSLNNLVILIVLIVKFLGECRIKKDSD